MKEKFWERLSCLTNNCYQSFFFFLFPSSFSCKFLRKNERRNKSLLYRYCSAVLYKEILFLALVINLQGLFTLLFPSFTHLLLYFFNLLPFNTSFYHILRFSHSWTKLILLHTNLVSMIEFFCSVQIYFKWQIYSKWQISFPIFVEWSYFIEKCSYFLFV